LRYGAVSNHGPSILRDASLRDAPQDEGKNRSHHNDLMRGSCHARVVNSVTAQTSASSRSGEAPFDKPPNPMSHI
jgi:hypothetical protein